jgi:hypothetical protein
MPVYIETAYESLNKNGEELCGDHADIIRTEEFVLAVLADGLGSGVKAIILATMTSKNHIEHDVLRRVARGGCRNSREHLAGVQRTRNAYSPFTIIQIYNDGRAYLAEYDTHSAVFLRKGRIAELVRSTKEIAGKKISEATFLVQPGDRLVVFSDGALYAGAGKLLNPGWKHENISAYLGSSMTPEMSAARISSLLLSACECLYQGTPGDDTTVMTFVAQKNLPCAVR